MEAQEQFFAEDIVCSVENNRLSDNHSIGYCMIGYVCSYLRYYYPYEFITAYLNNANNEDDIKNGSELAQEYNIKIIPPKYGVSKDVYVFDKEKNVIAKGVASIKFLNTIVANDLYELSKTQHNSFMELLLDITNKTSLNSRQLDILIKIDYFSMFGNTNELLRIVDIFKYFKDGKAKSIKKDKLKDEKMLEVVSKYATDVNAKGKTLKSYTITNMNGLLEECEFYIKSLQLNDLHYKVKMANQLELLGYIDITTNKEEDRRKLLVTNLIPLKNKTSEEIWGYAVFTRSIGSGKTSRLTVRAKAYDQEPFNKMDILFAKSVNKNAKGYWYLIDYEIVV